MTKKLKGFVYVVILYLIIIMGSYLIIPVLNDAHDLVSTIKGFLSGRKMCLYADLIDLFSLLWKLALVSLILFIPSYFLGFIKNIELYFILNIAIIILLAFILPFFY